MVSHGLRSIPWIARYRARFGQWDWVAHRLAGLGVVLFLVLHVLDTSTAVFAPQAYEFFLRIYKNPIFGMAEIALAGAVIYHAMNGLRVTIMDFWPHLYDKQPQARLLVWLATIVLFVPTAVIMFVRIVQHNF